MDEPSQITVLHRVYPADPPQWVGVSGDGQAAKVTDPGRNSVGAGPRVFLLDVNGATVAAGLRCSLYGDLDAPGVTFGTYGISSLQFNRWRLAP